MSAATAVNTWLPHDWVCEHIPDPQAYINAFLHCDNGEWWMRPATEDDRERFGWSEQLTPGQIVPFDLNRAYGYFEATLHEDGTIEGIGGIPADATHFVVNDDDEFLSDTVKGAVESAEAAPGPIDVNAYHWSGPYHFRFDIINGIGCFIQEASA
ncbi:hypothetical protein IFT84_20400 [Rhizobium sp. CFBP 8762]|uniref:hypothetical protein n=1 Tax=Rhizobium sp. CFBP 8762 TaxID=2775279 RepID=UPI001784903E|nr:hypothetical protein [Rhizobium sp. CFBP 8762]MBD8556874.1 hypothetical protein [Rhizobium sp. CFBP 8762]